MSVVSDGGTILAASFPTTTTYFQYLTFFSWVKFPSSTTGVQALVGLAGTASGKYSTSIIKANSNNSFDFYSQDDTSASIFASPTASVSANTWYPVCGVLKVGSFVSILSTGQNANASGSVGVGTYSQIQLMALQQNGGSVGDFLNSGGELAECAIWNQALSATEQQELVFNQRSPWNVRRKSLFMYAPLRVNAQDYGPNHFAFLPSGTGGITFGGDHPITDAIIPPRKTFLFDVGSSSITGGLTETTATTTISATGGPIVAGALAETIIQTISATGGPKVAGALAETVSQTISATGGPIVAGALAETVSQTISATGGPKVAGALTETLATTTISATGGPIVGGALSSQVSQTISATGGPIVGGALSEEITQALEGTGTVLNDIITGALSVVLDNAMLFSSGDLLPDYITVEVLPTGGVVGLTMYSLDQKGPWTLTRSLVGSTAAPTILYDGPPMAPSGNPAIGIPFIDAGDGTSLPLNPTKQYAWTFTTFNGTVTTAPIFPICSITVEPDHLSSLMIKMMQAGVESLRVPAGYNNKPTVMHAMPLTGNPPLPLISVNEDLLQQEYVGIGDSVNTDIRLNQYVLSAIVKRRYSVTVITTTTDERKFYRDAIISIFRTMCGPALGRLGSNISHQFQAADSQEVSRDQQPGFYYSVVMLEISGNFNVTVTTDYGLVEVINPDETFIPATFEVIEIPPSRRIVSSSPS